ncbi:hypothetical protein VTO42DRAFT_158 [Malbranchea cinnamomea]
MGDKDGGATRYERVPFGKEMRKLFSFADDYTPLNHGSYGATPTAILAKADAFRRESDARPSRFMRYDYPRYLDAARAALAKFLDVPMRTVVLVPNATTGVNTVLRNLTWNPDGKDEIIQLSIIYPACGKTTEYICEYNNDIVRTRQVSLPYPIEDEDLVAAYRSVIHASRAQGRRPRIAIFDTVASLPGVRLPFEKLAAMCREEQILSVIDGAHGIGHVKLDLPNVDPDFFVSNCHKWLFVPRGCAVLYVPERNQHLIRTSVPTTADFVPRSANKGSSASTASLGGQSEFERNFSFLGTDDRSAWLTIPEAIRWREEVCGGEENIRTYCRNLAREGSTKVAEILGTHILDNKTHSITDCCMVNVRLPLSAGLDDGTAMTREKVVNWIQRTVVEEYDSYLQLFYFQGGYWVRLSGQIYLDLSDFEWIGGVLKKVCERAEHEALA